jgi:hypothetical protein
MVLHVQSIVITARSSREISTICVIIANPPYPASEADPITLSLKGALRLRIEALKISYASSEEKPEKH